MIELKEEQITKMTKEKKYLLGKLYFDLDGHNIFKRVDRYNNKKILFIICFVYLTGFNIFEIIDNIYLLAGKHDSDSFSPGNRTATLTISMIYIGFILVLTSFTVVKMKVETCFYF